MPSGASVVRSCRPARPRPGADAYLVHFESAVLPGLRRLAGHRGALVLRRPEGDEIRITVLTLWASRAAIEEFAGADATAAIVEPEARAVLASFDARAEHFDLALDTVT